LTVGEEVNFKTFRKLSTEKLLYRLAAVFTISVDSGGFRLIGVRVINSEPVFFVTPSSLCVRIYQAKKAEK